MTPTTWVPASNRARRLPTAKSGVPMKTMRRGLGPEAVFIVLVFLDFFGPEQMIQDFSQGFFIGLCGFCQHPFPTGRNSQQSQDPFFQEGMGGLFLPFVANIAASALFGAVFPKIIE